MNFFIFFPLVMKVFDYFLYCRTLICFSLLKVQTDILSLFFFRLLYRNVKIVNDDPQIIEGTSQLTNPFRLAVSLFSKRSQVLKMWLVVLNMKLRKRLGRCFVEMHYGIVLWDGFGLHLVPRPRLFKSWIALSTGKIAIQWLRFTKTILRYPVDSDLSGGQRYPPSEQLGPDLLLTKPNERSGQIQFFHVITCQECDRRCRSACMN